MLNEQQVIDNLKILVEEEREKSILLGYKRTKWSNKLKEKIIEACNSSNMSKEKFFNELGIDSTFYHYWKNQIKPKQKETKTLKDLLVKIANLEKELEKTKAKAKEEVLKQYNLN